MTTTPQRPPPLPAIGRPLPGAGALVLALLLTGCGGGSDVPASPTAPATCASPGTHCAPRP